MKEQISPLIQATELLELCNAEDDLVIVDASTGPDAKSNYEKAHLSGAIFVDLNTQLADIKEDVSHGGRHPLPGIEQFSRSLSNLGITSKSHVVLYDDKNGANAAARLWWMLKAVGHKKVQVLDGGYQEAKKMNVPVRSKTETVKKVAPYRITTWKLPLADIEEVEAFSKKGAGIIIDVREAARYNGVVEPLDLIAGHIPGAVNIPFTNNLNENGLFLSPTRLKETYRKVFGNTQSEKIIVHCGSGVTACHTLLAIAYSGMEIPKLYVGSWSEWSRNNKAMVTHSLK